MVTLPPEFTATKLPGYFWNTKTHELYSIKTGGELKKLKLTTPNYFNHLREVAYRVSHKGRRRNLYISYLEGLKPTDSEIQVVK